jgi:predicted dehydrogenase
MKKYRVLIVGCGQMGSAHAKAYHEFSNTEIVGLVSRNIDTRNKLNSLFNNIYDTFSNYYNALSTQKPDIVCISTYPDTHEEYSIAAFNSGAHVFLEKPVAPTLEGCVNVINEAKKQNRKLLVGYILRHHPSWRQFITEAGKLGKPLVMRMNLNQQSSRNAWCIHKTLMESATPITDCAVHYVDIMCQMTKSKPVKVSAIGANLSNEISASTYNYGQLQVIFEDGSIGWYEVGWGPMMSDNAYFIKDVIGPNGAVSMINLNDNKNATSDNVKSHVEVAGLKIHNSQLDGKGNFKNNDYTIKLPEELEHDQLCLSEQKYLIKAMENNIDLSTHWNDVINSQKIVMAADESIRTGNTINLSS